MTSFRGKLVVHKGFFLFYPDTQVSTRCNINSREILDSVLMRSLQDMLNTQNRQVKSFKTAIESVLSNATDYKLVIHSNKVPNGEHRGRYNASSTSEVAVIIIGQQFDKRDIVLRCRDDNLQIISELHRSYDSLQYPLMFPYGEDGYSIESIDIPQVDPVTTVPTQKKSFIYGMLFNQYIVDQYAKIESERLAFIRHNKKTLRAESYIHLQDA
ncbi:hypothetical protein AGLY_017082 [Aphis glycines]|uniref:Helitron helicase-like domain-containing protein n=1 Tax=Aphis glycines TaxID=307491 RepID=A0A6G0SXY3_APHGL|nr:hypothetical protein AGLY_017082 [Aphis glycines]